MKVAIIHDWLTGLRGGERCLLSFLELYPDADIYTLFHVPNSTDSKIDERVRGTSFLQKLPGIKNYYRYLLPLFPLAIRGFDLRGYDLVISLSHAAAKNVNIPKGIPHVCFCFTPMRYIWDQADKYFGKFTPYLWPVISYLRKWDYLGTNRVTKFVAISKFVAARIRCYYGANAEVIFPPVDTSWIRPAQSNRKGRAFLYAGALVPYKRCDLVVQAFNLLGEELWIVGSGPEEKKLRAMANGNIKFFGKVSDAELAECYRNSRALIFPGIEDFGMIPIECLAAGRPLIGMYDGALKETHQGIRHWLRQCRQPKESTGVFIKQQLGKEVEALTESVRYFISKESEFDSKFCIERAQAFSVEEFRIKWNTLLESLELPPLPEVVNDRAMVA